MKIQLPELGGIEIDKDDYNFLQKISSSDFIGLIGGDWIKFWRWQNLTKIAEKVRKISEERNLNPQKVAPKFVKVFFENASLEENDDVQRMWANLLVEQTTNGGVNIYYLNILKELEPTEARLLDFLYKQSNNSSSTNFSFDLIMQGSKNITENELRVTIHKLYSFNILRPPITRGVSFGSNQNGKSFAPALETTDTFRFTEMGLDFCSKCSQPIVG